MLQAYMPEFEHEGKRYRVVYDECHETRGSYAYDTEEETREAEETELANLASGKWVVVGVIVSEPHTKGCQTCCPEWIECDSLWGIVVDNDPAKVREYVLSAL